MGRCLGAELKNRAMCFCLWLALFLVPQVVLAAPKRIVYFDPDANHQAIVEVSNWFNRYLDGGDTGLSFQALSSREDLEKILHSEDVAFAMVPSHMLQKPGMMHLEPMLVPVRNRDPYYRKLLMDRREGTPGDLRGRKIAATLRGGNDATAKMAVLQGLARANVQVSSALVIPVSKDIDGLLALAFGQVDAALVTRESLKVLARINPRATKGLREILQTPRILRSPLTILRNRSSNQLRLKLSTALKKMAQDPAGRRAMSMLGFDDWMAFEPSMLEAP